MTTTAEESAAAMILCSRCGREGEPCRRDRPVRVCRDCNRAYNAAWMRRARARDFAGTMKTAPTDARRATPEAWAAWTRRYRAARDEREPGWRAKALDAQRVRRAVRQAITQGRERYGAGASFAVARHEATGRVTTFAEGEPLRPGFAVAARVRCVGDGGGDGGDESAFVVEWSPQWKPNWGGRREGAGKPRKQDRC